MNFSKYKDWIIPSLVLGSILTTWIVILLLKYFLTEIVVVEYWPATLMLNLMSYGYIFLPGYAVFKYVKKNNNYLESGVGPIFFRKFLTLCYIGNPEESISDSIEGKNLKRNTQTGQTCH